MIVLNQGQCALECDICGELDGISERAMANETTQALLTARMAQEHAECEQWAAKPERAKAERAYKVRMRALMRGIE